MNHLFECEEDNWRKQFAGLMNIISDVLTGQFILNGTGDSNDLSYQQYRTEKRQVLISVAFRSLV